MTEVKLEAPTSPAKVTSDKDTKLSGIKISVEPVGHALTWTIEGDDDGTLVQVKPNEFEYTRGSSPGDDVTLTFASVQHPNRSTELEVKKE